MNQHKICFIYCTNDATLFNESLLYVHSLDVPDHMQIEVIAIDDAKSMTEGYNRAMRQSDAKYKVYLHQDVFIINKQFIHEVVHLFENNPQLGMLGVVGAKRLPDDGVWWDAKEKYGKVLESHTGKMEALNFSEVHAPFEEVQVIDGLIMMTQVDIPWREDIFHDWHFYDASQSLEFYRAGYAVGVPNQTSHWCIHDCGIANTDHYEEQKGIFLQEYAEDLRKIKEELVLRGESFIQSQVAPHYTAEERKRISDQYAYDTVDRIFISQHAAEVNYADGSEDYLTRIFSEVDDIDVKGEALLPYIIDWPSKYHLSPVRNNLLETVKELVDPKAAVLELGGGVGASTHWMGLHFDQVDVIEGSRSRAKANRLRNKNAPNVNIYVDDLLQLNFPRTNYQLATLIGVLEYIPYFAQAENPSEACIHFLRGVGDHLADDGMLMIAIENRLGAKYFAGCSEDHNVTLFSGINGYPDPSPLTFSRHELKEILTEAGYTNIQFYHCFPDYKLPKVIMRECDEMYEFDLGGIVGGGFQDYSGHREHIMPDQLLIDSFASAKLVHEFSNSFMVLCSKSTDVNLQTKAIITKFWNEESLLNIFHHKIEFHKREDGRGGKYIKRTPMHDNATHIELEHISFKLQDDVLYPGKNLKIEACRSILSKAGYGQLLHILNSVHQQLLEQFSLQQVDHDNFTYVDGRAIDFCIHNLLRSPDGSLNFIDRKWTYKQAITEDFVIFRSVLVLFLNMFPYIKEDSMKEFIMNIMMNLFPQYHEDRFHEHLEQESKFMTQIAISEYKYDDIEVGISGKSMQWKVSELSEAISQMQKK